jgi:hypothetical protein
MDANISVLFVKKLNEICEFNHNNLIYALLPLVYLKSFEEKTHTHSLEKIPQLVNVGQQILNGVRASNNVSYPYVRINEEKENLFKTLADLKDVLKLGEVTVNSDIISSAFAVISSIYLNTFVFPIQFFLPNSSACCGQWQFWEKSNYLDFLRKIKEKEYVFGFREELSNSEIWNMKFNPGDFSEIVRRRLEKENAFEKKLKPEALMKAMIIRMGEMAKPHLNYEVIDYSIRSFFTALGVSGYLRVDREIKFLRELEKKITKILSE